MQMTKQAVLLVLITLSVAGCETIRSSAEYRSDANQIVQQVIPLDIKTVHLNSLDMLRKCVGYAAIGADYFGDTATISASNGGVTIAVIDLAKQPGGATSLTMPVIDYSVGSLFVSRRIVGWAGGTDTNCFF